MNQRDIDKANAKSDYIAMMMGIDISAMSYALNAQAGEDIPLSEIKDTESLYDKVKNYYVNELWGIVAVRNAIGRWIDQKQYDEIIKAKVKTDSKIDTVNDIPAVSI